MKNKSTPVRLFKENPDEETDKEKLRKEIEEQTKEFLKFKRNKIEKIPRGMSKELCFALNKKQKERFAKKQTLEGQTILKE